VKKDISLNPFYIGFMLALSAPSLTAATTILTDADFPRGHTYVNGSGNTIYIQNNDTVYLNTAINDTGVLSSENGGILIVDNHVHVTNTGRGDAILITDGGKAYFNNGLTAVSGPGNDYYAIASIRGGAELHVVGTTNIYAPDNIGYGLYLGATTNNSFDGVVNINAGLIGIYTQSVSSFTQRVNINMNGKKATGIYGGSNTSSLLTFDDLVTINLVADGDFSGYNYGVQNYNNKINLNGGLIVDLTGDSYDHGRIGVFASQGQVNIGQIFSVYAPKDDMSYAMYATSGGKIYVNDALVDLNGHITASGAGSLIDMTAQSGSVIRGNAATVGGGTVNFNVTGTRWYFDDSSQLTSLAATDSHIFFPSSGSGSFSTLTVENLAGRDNTFWLNTVLNDGSTQETDRIIINQNGTGQHQLHITNVGGTGDATLGDGIKVVEVNGTSQADNFSLANVVRGGIYEYTLHQGTVGVPADQSWYLRSSARQLNPDIGSYLANQTAATGLFMHGLHDRLGEPQFAERYKADGSQPSVWLRTSVSHAKNQAGGGVFDQHSEGYLVHLGGEIANWTSDDSGRYHLGVMGAYGKSDTRTRSIATDSRVSGSVDGYSVGAYLTWYENDSQPEGWYTDIWSMYSWFDNQTESTAKYKSHAWTGSAEVGYAVKALESGRWQWMAEPHVQAAYTDYRADEHTDSNGMRVSDDDASGVYTRVGARFYLRDGQNEMNAQPFIEANWLHNTAKNSLKFNGEKISDDTPKNRFEGKIGVQGAVTKSVQIYSHIGLQWGQDKYERAEGQIGVKYRF
jgi:autotransporter family porin